MVARVKVLALLGIILAVLLIGAVTFPYVTIWVNLSDESNKFHVAYVDGETYIWHLGVDSYHKSSVFVNVTLVSTYPKAAVEAISNMFSAELVFFVVLHPNVTEFICDEIRMNFRSLTGNYDYYGLETLSFSTGSLVDFYRWWRDEGNIMPFSANVTLTINPGSLVAIPSELNVHAVLRRQNRNCAPSYLKWTTENHKYDRNTQLWSLCSVQHNKL